MFIQTHFFPQAIYQAPFKEFRNYCVTNQINIHDLYQEYINNEQWTQEHPDFVFKTFAILDPLEQNTEQCLQLFKIISLTDLLRTTNTVQQVIQDAIAKRNWGFILQLIDNGVPISTRLHKQNTFLHEAVVQKEDEVVKELLKRDASPNLANSQGYTPLHIACYKGSFDAVTFLIDAGAELERRTELGKTPLHLACEYRKEKTVILLINNGADVDAEDPLGDTPLVFSICAGLRKTPLLIIDKLKFLDHVDYFGQTALHFACYEKLENVALKLIEKKASLEVTDACGDTPLHIACKIGLYPVAKALLSNKANPLATNQMGFTPLYYVLSHQQEDFVFLFRRKFSEHKWQVELLNHSLTLSHEDSARGMIESWKLRNSIWPILSEALLRPNLVDYLMKNGRDLLNRCRNKIREHDFSLEQKLILLPLLCPEKIGETLQACSKKEMQKWIDQKIKLESQPDQAILAPISHMLDCIYQTWIPYIDWNEDDPLGPSGSLISEISQLLEQVPLKTLAACALLPSYQKILISFFPALSPDQMAVVIPQLPVKAFVDLSLSHPLVFQTTLLKFATSKQKKGFLMKVPLKLDQKVADWVEKEIYQFYREWIELKEQHQLKKPIEIPLKAFLQKMHAKECSLPATVNRHLIQLNALKKALLSNKPPIWVKRLIQEKVVIHINQNQLGLSQFQSLRVLVDNNLPVMNFTPVDPIIPHEFLCGILQTTMTDPVTAHGHSFERQAIETWLNEHNTCPLCRKEVVFEDFVTDVGLRARIKQFTPMI